MHEVCTRMHGMHMDEGQEWHHEATFAAEPASVSKARAFVCRHLLHHRRWHLVDPVRVVASELSTNAVARSGSSFTIALWESGSQVYVAVHAGTATATATALVPGQRAAPEPGARGRLRLTIVELLSEECGERPDGRGGTEVWASFATVPLSA
jgi:hypothetical protein